VPGWISVFFLAALLGFDLDPVPVSIGNFRYCTLRIAMKKRSGGNTFRLYGCRIFEKMDVYPIS